MRRPTSLVVLMIGIVSTSVGEYGASPPGGRPPRADRPPRKVDIGTAIFGPRDAPTPGIDGPGV